MQDFNPMSNWGDAAKRLLGEDFWNSIVSQMNMGAPSGTSPNSQFKPSAYPLIDLVESEQDLYVLVELPGLRHPQSIDVYVEGDLLHVKGELTPVLPRGEIRQSERRRGPFERSVALPVAVQKESIRAKYENGVLEIKLPKLKQKTPRTRVPIDF